MFEALEYSGYDVKLEMGEGGHSGQEGASLMPDILRWLWHDYPQPITVREPAAMSQPGWGPRGKVSRLAATAKGDLYFTDPVRKTIAHIAPE
jgi:gluconolactonase